MAVHEINTRDYGLALASRVNRWLIGGAVAGAGCLSLVAAQAFHGRTLGSSAPTPSRVHSVSSAPSSAAGGGLQQPAQAPAPSTASPAPVVSGGS